MRTSFDIFDCVYTVDGESRHAWFRVPRTVPVPRDCVIWVHGGGQTGSGFMQRVPPRPDRIDVFPTALESNGDEISYDLLTQASLTDCSSPRLWVTPGMPTLAPFAPGYSGPGPDCRTHPYTVDPYTGQAVLYAVQPGADPKAPRQVVLKVLRALDTWTDLRFLCKLVRKIKLGSPPHECGVSLDGATPTSWAPAPVRVWLAGFSKGGLLVLWAHAYNRPHTYIPGTTPGLSSGLFDELEQIDGYFISSAPMPLSVADDPNPRHTFPDFKTFSPTRKICGYWHGSDDNDGRGAAVLPGQNWDDSADILAGWYGATWSPWQVLTNRPKVCTARGTPGGFVQTQYGDDGSGGPPLLRRYQVIDGEHEWTHRGNPGVITPQSVCAATVEALGKVPWDEALVATALWRTGLLYGT